MELTEFQRLSLINQYKLLGLLDNDASGFYEELVRLLEEGLFAEFKSLTTEAWRNIKQSDLDFTRQILKMFLDFAEAREDKLVDEADYSKLPKFMGFSENYESKLLACLRHETLRGDSYRAMRPIPENSHLPFRNRYQKLLKHWSSCHKGPQVLPEEIACFLSKLALDKDQGDE